MVAGSRGMIQAPRIWSLYLAMLSAEVRSRRTTGPRAARPPVPAVQAQLQALTWRGKGVTSPAVIGPRSQVTPNGHDSSQACIP